MKYRFHIILALVFLATACDDYFDVAPKTDAKAETLFQDEQGFNDVLVGVYTLISTRTMYGDALSYSFLDVLAQYYTTVRSNSNHTFLEVSDFNYTEIQDENRIAGIWLRHYQAIANLNAILLFIDDNASVFNTGVYETFKGETLALRAYLHFNLLRMFGTAPIVDENSSSIPFVSEYTSQAQPALSVNEVLNKITDDLLLARDLMMDYDPYGPNYQSITGSGLPRVMQNRQYRMNYYAATAALSLVYHYRGDETEALAYAQEIIGSTDATSAEVELFSLANLSIDPTAESENIFMLDVSQLDVYTDVYFGENAHLGQRNNWLAVNNDIVDATYAPSGNSSVDIRPDLFFGSSRGGERPLSKFFNRSVIPQLKISELFLLAAECESNLDNALGYYNAFTASRGIEAIEGVTEEELDNLIYQEYKKEFIGEGKLFWFYKRLNFDVIGILDNVNIEDSEIYTFPIPAKEIEFGNL